MNEKIYINNDGKQTTAIITKDGKKYIGVARCSPEDSFSAETGAVLALSRAFIEMNQANNFDAMWVGHSPTLTNGRIYHIKDDMYKDDLNFIRLFENSCEWVKGTFDRIIIAKRKKECMTSRFRPDSLYVFVNKVCHTTEADTDNSAIFYLTRGTADRWDIIYDNFGISDETYKYVKSL